MPYANSKCEYGLRSSTSSVGETLIEVVEQIAGAMKAQAMTFNALAAVIQVQREALVSIIEKKSFQKCGSKIKRIYEEDTRDLL